MGRILNRVPLDFDHPLGEVWPGYTRTCREETCAGEETGCAGCDGCTACDGCDDCNSVEPPEGPGYQLWENVSEGSPISPVFADVEEFISWVVEDQDVHPDSVRKFLTQKYAPTMMIAGTMALRGIDCCGLGIHLKPGTRVRHTKHGTEGAALEHEAPAGYAIIQWDADIPGVEGKRPEDNLPVTTASPYDNLEILEPGVDFDRVGIRRSEAAG